jgi:hypothetical protein
MFRPIFENTNLQLEEGHPQEAIEVQAKVQIVKAVFLLK